MTQLFRNESSDPKTNAQRNLAGRTHYVDDDTLRFHKSRVLTSRILDNGLLFAITTSDAINPDNTKRGFRYVIFDVFGTVIDRPELENTFKRHESCIKAMWTALDGVDAISHTREAIEKEREARNKELNLLSETIEEPVK